LTSPANQNKVHRPHPLKANRSAERHPDPEAGQTLVEYALILVLFSVALMAVLQMFQGGLTGLYDTITQFLADLTS
jgi:Flp pilus assembly pilin Flp